MVISELTVKNIDDIKSFQENKTTKGITFIVTKDCQLACKYCYLVGKNSKERLSFEVARLAIEYILVNQELSKEDSVIWDFIGGEPFLEIDLIKKICDYIKTKMFRLNHHWFNSYRFSFSTSLSAVKIFHIYAKVFYIYILLGFMK